MIEIVVIILLQIVNGLFSMSEAALIAARKPRLHKQAKAGSAGADAALRLAADPNRFFSTVQIFITLIGILGGAFGGATLAGDLAALFAGTALEPYGQVISLALIVLATTYVSLIIGELVPKRLALRSPEQIAAAVARPMTTLSNAAAPVVRLLSGSTDVVLRLLGAARMDEPVVTEDEIRVMIQQGVAAGVFEEAEHDMVENIFRLNDRRIAALMIPRLDVIYLDVQDTPQETRARLMQHPFSRYPVCDGGLDRIIGLVQTKDLVVQLLAGEPLDLRACAIEPIFVPDSTPASRVLEMFRKTSLHAAFVIDEYGALLGMVTVQDLLEAIVGDDDREAAVQRDDGSWLLDGRIDLQEMRELLQIGEPIEGEGDDFNTLGGFIMSHQGRIPVAGDVFEWNGFRIEVVDMDGHRVDKVLIARLPPPAAPSSEDAD